MKKIKPQMVVIKKTDNNKYWQWMWKGKPSHISGRNKCEMIYIYIYIYIYNHFGKQFGGFYKLNIICHMI